MTSNREFYEAGSCLHSVSARSDTQSAYRFAWSHFLSNSVQAAFEVVDLLFSLSLDRQPCPSAPMTQPDEGETHYLLPVHGAYVPLFLIVEAPRWVDIFLVSSRNRQEHPIIQYTKVLVFVFLIFFTGLLLIRSDCHASTMGSAPAPSYIHEELERQLAPGSTNGGNVRWGWIGLKPSSHCLRYGTREYTAALQEGGVGNQCSRGWTPYLSRSSSLPQRRLLPTQLLEACRKTPAEIHGQLVLPNFCLDLVRAVILRSRLTTYHPLGK